MHRCNCRRCTRVIVAEHLRFRYRGFVWGLALAGSFDGCILGHVSEQENWPFGGNESWRIGTRMASRLWCPEPSWFCSDSRVHGVDVTGKPQCHSRILNLRCRIRPRFDAASSCNDPRISSPTTRAAIKMCSTGNAKASHCNTMPGVLLDILTVTRGDKFILWHPEGYQPLTNYYL